MNTIGRGLLVPTVTLLISFIVVLAAIWPAIARREMRNGRRFHQCFCGGAGFITGTIETIGSNRLAVEVDPGAAKPPTPKSEGLRVSRCGLDGGPDLGR
jgi:hypothetical protein